MKNSFVDRVVSFLKLDDKGKVEKFQSQAIKVWEKQIEIRRAEILEKQEKQAELVNEKAEEIVLNVNVDKIKTIDDRERYIDSYKEKLLALKVQIENFDDEIDILDKEIDTFTWLIEQVK